MNGDLFQKLIDALNTATDNGKNILFLWGHNHSMNPKDGNYDKIFKPGSSITYKSGNTKTLKFVYAAAGAMSDSEYTGSGNIKGKGLVVKFSDEEKENTAYHEVGHALLAKLLKNCDPLHKVSIIPRGMALGITLTLPEKDHLTMRKQQLLDRITMILGGRVAEELIYGKDNVTTGASNDIERATSIARAMITQYGMSDKFGFMNFASEEEIFVGRDYEKTKSYSEKVAGTIDDEVKVLIDKAYDRCRTILSENSEKLETVVQFLLENETMTRNQFKDCMEGRAIGEAEENPMFSDLEVNKE